MKKVILCALSCAAFCCAMNRETEQPDVVAMCIVKAEDKICESLKKLIGSQEKKDLQIKKDEKETQKVDMPQVGKSVMTSNGIVKLPLPDNRRFGRGCSAPGESQELLAKL